jgi:nucleoid DNA-binding protein
MSEPKVSFILDETMQFAVRQLLQGYIVEVPQFGTLRLSIKTKAKNRRIDAGVKAIENISVNFLPCPKMRKLLELNNLQFKIEDQ